MDANYFFVDGSALTVQIRRLQRAIPSFGGRKLCPKKLANYFMWKLGDLHGNTYKRFTFYFPTGDEANVSAYLEIPNFKNPGEVRDLHFKFCGSKLKKSSEFDKFVEENVPEKFLDRFQKSEKGIDIEMCCDALKLASMGRIDRLFLLSNDGDFIPLCRTLKEFGANISLVHLSDVIAPNLDLLREADSYDVVTIDQLQTMFLPIPDQEVLQAEVVEQALPEVEEAIVEQLSEKPDAEPSDLNAAEGEGQQ